MVMQSTNRDYAFDIPMQQWVRLTSLKSEPTIPEVPLSFKEYGAQLRHEIALLKQVPEMKSQRKGMESKLRDTEKAIIANEVFQAYTPNHTWLCGFLSNFKSDRPYLLYNRALPQEAIDALNKAKSLGVFDQFTVHSPDKSAFDEIRPVVQRIDPVLVGWIGPSVSVRQKHSPDGITYYGNFTEVIGGTGFLLHAWDLAKDLAYNPNQLPAGV